VFGVFRIALSKRRAEKRKKLERKNNFLVAGSKQFRKQFHETFQTQIFDLCGIRQRLPPWSAMDLRGIHFPQERARS